jgi:ligand-binding sensor domain-containing protein/signal transduction histidine kinase/DNA-binding NarL/FixJ family response regulator
MRKHLLLNLCLALPWLLPAQPFRHLYEGAGLAAQSIVAIAQDSQGFMWFGGRYGLTRYDGAHFRVFTFKVDDSSSVWGDEVTALLRGRGQELWVGTNHGLLRYDPATETFKRLGSGALARAHINSLCFDRMGDLWLGARIGLYRMDGRHPDVFDPVIRTAGDKGAAGEKGSTSDKGEPQDTRAVYEDSQGRIWVGCTLGLVRVEPATGGYRFSTYPVVGATVTSIWENPKTPGAIWAGTDRTGVCSIDLNTGATTTVLSANGANRRLPHNNVSTICPDGRGNLWIGTQEGLSIYDPASGRSSIFRHESGDNSSLSQNYIFSIFKDADGSMWVGTYFGGINLAFAHSTNFTTYHSSPSPSGISNDVISCFAEDRRHNLWIGTDGGGLDYFDRSNAGFTVLAHNESDKGTIHSNLIKSIYVDGDQNIWVGTHGGGLNIGQGKRFRQVFKDTLVTEVESLLEDREGRFWVGSEDRLRLYTRKQDQLLPYRGPVDLRPLEGQSSFHLLFEDSKGNIWASVGPALYELKHGETRFTRNPVHGASLSDFEVNCICEDHRGGLWFGTYRGGLLYYDPTTGSVRSYGEKQGLPDNTVLSVGEDRNGRLWLGTAMGLTCLDPQMNGTRNFTASDGLPPGGFNYNAFHRDSSGRMYFGGFNGFVSFLPENIDLNPRVSAPVFVSLDVLNSPVVIGAKDGLLDRSILYKHCLSLGYDQNEFTVGFALLNFIKPEKNRYAYKMEGVDRDWHEAGFGSATYAGLPAGHYTFLVKGANNDGVWSAPATLDITIRPPFWKTGWAFALYAAIAITIVSLIMRQLFLRERLKHQGALHQAKLNFFTNISHEIRTHLSLIAGPVERLLLRPREEDRRQLQYIKTHSESLLQLVKELMDFRKAESGNLALQVSSGDLVVFTRQILHSFEHLAAARAIPLGFAGSGESIPLAFDPEQLGKVIVNLVSNAFKFTPDGGKIDVRIEEKRSTVEIRVTDNGRGIAAENLPKLFTNYFQENEYGARNTGYGIGLALSKTIVELHKGHLKVQSEPGVATSFTVSLPKKAVSTPPSAPEPAEGLLLTTALSPATAAAPTAKKYSVLIVEDNSELRSFLRSILEDGYQVQEASDGLKGWESATEGLPDLVITDVMMPEMDGFTLCNRLKSDLRTSHIPIILLTAKSSTADQISGLERGADIFLAKPFSIHVLTLHIRNLLAARERLRRRYVTQLEASPGMEEGRTMDDQFMKKALDFIAKNMDDPDFGVAALATHMLMSQPVLYKKIRALTDMSVNEFIKGVRLRRAARLLREQRHTVYEVANMVGYVDRKHFSQEFKKMFEVNPSEYGKAKG